MIEKKKQDQADALERKAADIKKAQELKKAAELRARRDTEDLKRSKVQTPIKKPLVPEIPKKADLKVPVVPDNLKPKEVTKELWKPDVPKIAERKTNVTNPNHKTKFEKPVIDQLPVKAPTKKQNFVIPTVKKPEYVPPPVEQKVVKKKIVKPVIEKKVYEKPRARVEDFMKKGIVEEPIYQQEEYEVAREERYVEKLEYFIEDEVEEVVHQEFLPYREDILAEIRDSKIKQQRFIDHQFKKGTVKKAYEYEERRTSPYRRRDDLYEEEERNYSKKTYEDEEYEEVDPKQVINSQRKASNYTEQPRKMYDDEVERKESFGSQAKKV